jgi:hypothetical protein
MNLDKLDQELLLEAGVALLAAGLVGGAAMLAIGRAAGGAQRGRRHREGPPSPGSVPAERHQQTGAASAR